MKSSDDATKRREVRKVEIILEDSYHDDGTPGLLVEMKFLPEIEDADDLTISQRWGQYIIESILSQSTLGAVIDDSSEFLTSNAKKDPDPTLN